MNPSDWDVLQMSAAIHWSVGEIVALAWFVACATYLTMRAIHPLLRRRILRPASEPVQAVC